MNSGDQIDYINTINLQPTLMIKKYNVFINENAYAGGYRPGILMDLFI